MKNEDMKSDKIRRAIGGIDDGLIESADSTVKHARIKWITAAAAVFAVLLMGAMILPRILRQNGEAVDGGVISGGHVESVIIKLEDHTETDGGDKISSLVSIKMTGEKITDEEAAKYFDETKKSIFSALSESGVDVSDARISYGGYCHVRYEGAGGKESEYIQNFRDYPVYNGDRLVAIITLSKEDGKLYATPAFGAPWFDRYNEYLTAHKGQELIYLYVGNAEIILAPDGDNIEPQGGDVTALLGGIDKPYEQFYNKDAVFVP